MSLIAVAWERLCADVLKFSVRVRRWPNNWGTVAVKATAAASSEDLGGNGGDGVPCEIRWSRRPSKSFDGKDTARFDEVGEAVKCCLGGKVMNGGDSDDSLEPAAERRGRHIRVDEFNPRTGGNCRAQA